MRNQAIVAFLIFVVGLALWVSFFSVDRFEDRDAYDYAQIGRELRLGNGYSTLQTFPRHIPYMEENGHLDGRWPNLLRYPLSPTLNAMAQLVVADPVTASVVQTGIWFLMSVPVFFLLAAHLVGLRLAVVATLVFLGDPRVLRDSYNGMTESLAIFIVLSVFFLMLRPSVRQGRWSSWLFIGILCGLGYLSRTQLIVLVPLCLAVAVWSVPKGRRVRSVALLLAGAVLAIFPWLMRNFVVTGDPTFAFTNSRNLLAHTATHSGIDRHLDGPISVADVLESHHHEILDKVGHHLWPNIVDPRFWTEALGMYAFALPLALIGILGGWGRVGGDRSYDFFERSVVLLLLANFVIVCLIYHRQRYYDPFIPLMTIILVQRVFWMVKVSAPKRSPKVFNAVAAVCIALAGGRLVSTLDEHRQAPGISSSDQHTYERLKTLLKDDDVVVSDLSAQLALYGGWRCIRCPAKPEDILEIDRNYLEIDSVLISQRGLKQGYRQWLESEEFLTRFERSAVLPNQATLYRRVSTDGPPGSATQVVGVDLHFVAW